MIVTFLSQQSPYGWFKSNRQPIQSIKVASTADVQPHNSVPKLEPQLEYVWLVGDILFPHLLHIWQHILPINCPILAYTLNRRSNSVLCSFKAINLVEFASIVSIFNLHSLQSTCFDIHSHCLLRYRKTLILMVFHRRYTMCPVTTGGFVFHKSCMYNCVFHIKIIYWIILSFISNERPLSESQREVFTSAYVKIYWSCHVAWWLYFKENIWTKLEICFRYIPTHDDNGIWKQLTLYISRSAKNASDTPISPLASHSFIPLPQGSKLQKQNETGVIFIYQGWTALHHAVQRGDTGICQLLLKETSTKNAPDLEHRQTPIYLAVNLCLLEIVSILLDHGVKLLCFDDRKR